MIHNTIILFTELINYYIYYTFDTSLEEDTVVRVCLNCAFDYKGKSYLIECYDNGKSFFDELWYNHWLSLEEAIQILKNKLP